MRVFIFKRAVSHNRKTKSILAYRYSDLRPAKYRFGFVFLAEKITAGLWLLACDQRQRVI
jgi:hypothetical protein